MFRFKSFVNLKPQGETSFLLSYYTVSAQKEAMN